MKQFVMLAGLVMAAASWLAQDSSPRCRHRGAPAQLATRASPLDSVETRLGGSAIKVCYGRPSARGRQIMGGLVPYGEPWRLGANEPTTLYLPFTAEIGGVRVDSGAYSLYAIPRESEWEIHVNRAVERWGIPIDPAVRAQDVGRGTFRVEALDRHVEQLTLSFTPPSRNATELVVEWERTRVRIPLRRL
jgi:hypothetical protein